MPSVNQLLVRSQQKLFNNLKGSFGTPFLGVIKDVNNESETLNVVHGTGINKHLKVMHPYIGANHWHRVAPDAGQKVVLQVRPSSKEPEVVAYSQSNDSSDVTPATRIQAYDEAKDTYRPLQGGEQEIVSSGFAQVFLARRAVMDQRAGYVRNWLDQDKLEAGARAVVHTRQLHLHKPNDLGDEERIGAVVRPEAGSGGASSFESSTPEGVTGGIGEGTGGTSTSTAGKSYLNVKFIDAPASSNSVSNQTVNVSQATDQSPVDVSQATDAADQVTTEASGAASEASTAAGSAAPSTGDSEPAKEYMRFLKTSKGPLIDFREGHVIDIEGEPVTGKMGNQLRSHKKVYGSSNGTDALSSMSTQTAAGGSGTTTWEEQIDDKNNWYVGLPESATEGILFEAPQGKFVFKSGTQSASLTLDGVQQIMKLIASQNGEVSADTQLKIKSQKVKLGQSEQAIHKAIKTQVYKNSERGLFNGLQGGQSTEGAANDVSGGGLNLLGSVFMAVAAAPLTPGAIVAVMGRAQTLIPTIFHAVVPRIKDLKGALGGTFGNAWSAYESSNVSNS